jgi:hypothetical protein
MQAWRFRMRCAQVVALCLLSWVFQGAAQAKKPISLSRYMRENRLKLGVEKAHGGYFAVVKGRLFELRSGGLLEMPLGSGKTPVAAVNHLVEQIRGRAVLFDAFTNRKDGRVPDSFETNQFQRLPAGTKVR